MLTPRAVLVLLLAAGAGLPQTQVERWDTYEVALRGGAYANPFRDVRLTAVFTHESGRSVTVQGFYDGDRT